MSGQNFWEQYEKDAQAESGGGGIIATVKIETVYKAFVGGVDQKDAYRPVPAGATKADKAASKAVLMELGAEKVDYGVQIIAHRDNAVSQGKAVTWQADRYFFQSSWNDACKSVVVPSLKEAGIATLPFTGWARIGFKPNPFNAAQGDAGKTDADKEGTPRFPQVAYVVEVFKDEGAARAAIGGEASEAVAAVSGDGNAPDGWELDTWQAQWKDIYDLKNPAEGTGKSNVQIATDYEVPIKFVIKALADYIPL